MVWTTGDTIDSTNFNGNWQAIGPIGGCMPWVKSLTGVPQTLPEGWLEMNGQSITDADSPMNGETMRDWNGVLSGVQRFIRGSSTSGTQGGAETNTHRHDLNTASLPDHFDTDNPKGSYRGGTDSGQADTANQTISVLPSYEEAVWICRIK